MGEQTTGSMRPKMATPTPQVRGIKGTNALLLAISIYNWVPPCADEHTTGKGGVAGCRAVLAVGVVSKSPHLISY